MHMEQHKERWPAEIKSCHETPQMKDWIDQYAGLDLKQALWHC